MAIIRTDKWLDEFFYEPEKICRQMKDAFGDLNEREIYLFLLEKGMYKPNVFTKRSFEQLKELNVWDKMEKIEKYYRNKWSGPNIPIYIFPIMQSFFQRKTRKDGFTFVNKSFLFLPPVDDNMELRALFVHEYHHACRMNRLKNAIEDNTLLDSVVMEGLAEHAVLDSCGKKYVSPWCYHYSEEEILYFWNKYFKPQLHVKISEPEHDQLLYGSLYSKPMIGYAIGFYLVNIFRKENKLTIDETFTVPSTKFLL